MKTIVEMIRVTEDTHKGKKVCRILMLDSSENPIQVTLWANSIAEGHEIPYLQMEGKKAWVDLRPEVWNGKLQFNLDTRFKPQEVNPKKAAPES